MKGTGLQQAIGLVFGGVSPEHEVSVISALQIAAALQDTAFEVVPVYISKEGLWFTGDLLLDMASYKDLDRLKQQAEPVMLEPAAYGGVLLANRAESGWLRKKKPGKKLDVLFLALHGAEGEDGSLQGLCETYNVPYTGSGVFGSALGMDKVHSKIVCRDQGVPIVSFVGIRESEWADQEEVWLDRIEKELGYPVIVKPARLGSSIGITRAETREKLDSAIEEAFRFDEKVICEYTVRNLREINCSVMGTPDEAEASLLEEPIAASEKDILSFKDKYMREDASGSKTTGVKAEKRSPAGEGMASLDRMIPAPISDELTQKIRSLAVAIFQLFECSGLARIDFMLDDATGEVYFNEINTIPGSFSFYLWGPAGVSFEDLATRLIKIALERHQVKNNRVRSYDVNLLALHSTRGAKGSK